MKCFYNPNEECNEEDCEYFCELFFDFDYERTRGTGENNMTEQKEKPKDKMAGFHGCIGCVALKFHKNKSPFCAVGIYHDCVVSGRIMKFVSEGERTT